MNRFAPECLQLIAQLRDAGSVVDYCLTPTKPDKQFKRALELNATHTVKLERAPAGGVIARIKDLRSRTEQLASVPKPFLCSARERRRDESLESWIRDPVAYSPRGWGQSPLGSCASPHRPRPLNCWVNSIIIRGIRSNTRPVAARHEY